MKFARNLTQNQIPEYRTFYINYNDLKKKIKILANFKRTSANTPSLSEFLNDLDKNVDKVDGFYSKQISEFEQKLESFKIKYEAYIKQREFNTGTYYLDEDDLLGALVGLRSQLQKLSWFAEVNKRGFTKIIKKLDKHLGTSLQIEYIESKVSSTKFATDWSIGSFLDTISQWIDDIQTCQSRIEIPDHSVRSKIKHSLSSTSIGVPTEDIDAIQSAISENDAKRLEILLNQLKNRLNEPIIEKWLSGIFMLAFMNHSKECSMLLLHDIKSCSQILDINGRSILHRYLINISHEGIRDPSKFSEPRIDTTIGRFKKGSSSLKTLGPHAVRIEHDEEDSSNESYLKSKNFLQDILAESESLRNQLKARDIYGKTPLHYAAQFGLEFACEVLMDFMIKYSIVPRHPGAIYLREWQDEEGNTPIHVAISSKHIACLRIMIPAGDGKNEDIINSPPYSKPAIILATELKCYRIVELLIDINFNINETDDHGLTALHHAARQNDKNSIELLCSDKLKQKADMEVKDLVRGWTPIFYACSEGANDAVDALIFMGASCEHVDDSGWTALEVAVYKGFVDIGHKLDAKLPDDYKYKFKNVSRDRLLASLKAQSVEESEKEPFKIFGHRYLQNETLVLITLGTIDVRKDVRPLELNYVTSSEDLSRHYNTSLSLLVYAKDNKSEAAIFDIPIDASIRTEPVSIFCTDKRELQINFDIVPSDLKRREEIIARAVFQPLHLDSSLGMEKSILQRMNTVSLLSRGSLQVIGCVNFEYTVFTPFSHLNIGAKNGTYWKSLIRTRVIGHRGLGKNQLNSKNIQLGENTLQSFIAAASLGASYVEFDVQLTKDMVPVIYHDFLVSETGIDAPMHSLTFEQFMAASREENHKPERAHEDPGFITLDDESNESRWKRSNDRANGRTRSFGEDDRLNDKFKYTLDFKKNRHKGNRRGISVQFPFATLEEILKDLPKEVGLNIECKYPMASEAEEHEMEKIGIDINSWIDKVLRVVFDHGDGRDILFSSFHPDICLALTMKQPCYPILFLTDAGSFEQADVRASSLQEAIRFATRSNLLGIVSAAEPIILCPRLMKAVKELGLVLFTYGAELNDPILSKGLLEMGVDAIIVDQVLAIRKGLQANQ